MLTASTSSSVPSAARTAAWSFPGLPGGRLADGDYTGIIRASAANGLAGDMDFVFTYMAGDVNHDRAVDGSDFAILAGNFGRSGRTHDTGDLTGDGSVNGSDFAILAGSFGKTLPLVFAPQPPPPQGLSARGISTAPVVAAPAKAAEAPPTSRLPTRRVIAKPSRPRRAL
jgi:hypothetical protein